MFAAEKIYLLVQFSQVELILLRVDEGSLDS